MKPYYEDKWVKIYHGDCRDVLPMLNGVGDIILTDPPYGNNTQYLSYVDTEDSLRMLVNDFMPMALERDIVAVTPGITNMWLYPRPSWVLCWYIGLNGVGYNPWGFTCWHPILVYGEDPYLSRGMGSRPDVLVHEFENRSRHSFNHPTPKPEKIWSKLITRLSIDTGQMIIDPFLGSGTTCYCAKKLNRYSIGIEIEEKYCEIAAKRCMQEVMDFSG